MGLDAIYVHVETNDVIWSNAPWEFLWTAHAQFVRRGDALHLNETCPLPAKFEFCRVIYAAPPQLYRQLLCE